MLGPGIAAISLGLVGHAAIGERLGRNARFASIGNGLAAAAMGACGYFFSARAVFIVTALLLIPALLALRRSRRARSIRSAPTAARSRARREPITGRVRAAAQAAAARSSPAASLLFHLANAAMLPLMGGVLTMRSSEWATVLIAACIVVPQLVVALISPWVGHAGADLGPAAAAAYRHSPRCRSAACCLLRSPIRT